MLILERRTGTAVRIGTDIRVRVTSVPSRNRVRLGLEVPPGVPIWREDLVGPALTYDSHVIDNSLHILHVEDDATHARLTRRALGEDSSLRLTHVPSAEAALGLLTSAGEGDLPQLILLDLHLPGQSGVDLLRAVRANPAYRHVSIVVLSFSDSDEQIENCLEAGANAYVTKALTFEEMTRSMARIVEFWRHTQHPVRDGDKRSDAPVVAT